MFLHDPSKPPSFLWTLFKIGGFIMVCGIVGPIFLLVGLATRGEPGAEWLLPVGAAITALDLFAAFAVSSKIHNTQVRGHTQGPRRRIFDEL